MPTVIPWSTNKDLNYKRLSGTPSVLIEYEMRGIALCPEVKDDSIEAYLSEADQSLLIICDIRREIGTTSPVNAIGTDERIAFKYRADSIGLQAPKVYSERSDFPKTLSHLNPVRETTPAYLCLSRDGSQNIYDRGGITAIVERVSQWLTDAAYGRLDKDGWEPRFVAPTAIDAQISISTFQEIAANVPKPVVKRNNFAAVNYIEIYDDNRLNRMFTQIMERQYAIKPKFERRGKSTCDLVIVGTQNRSGSYSCTLIETQDDLLNFAEDYGVREQVNQLLITYRTSSTKGQFDEELRILLFAVHRTRDLKSSILGQSDKDDAKKVEIIGFVLCLKKKGSDMKLTDIGQLNLISSPSPQLSAELSGLPTPDKSVVFVGAGAVGSLMALNHIKAGLHRATIIDHDCLMPHNLPRHVLPPDFIGMNKAVALQIYLNAYPSVQVSAKNMLLRNEHVESLSRKRFSYIVDSTSSPYVRKQLSYADSNLPVANVSIANGGKIGLLVCEDKLRGSQINDLFYYLYDLSYDHSHIRAWLKRAHDQEEIALGMGCATTTSRLPQASIETLTSRFFKTLRETPDADQSRIRAVVLDDDGLVETAISEDVPPPSNFVMLAEDGRETKWTCTMFDTVRKQVVSFMEESSPIESGGFLYGKVDPHIKRVTVVRAINIMPLSASATRCTLPPAERSSEHHEYRRKTAGSLQLLGTWHSHPTSSCTPSPIDISLIRERKENNEFLFGGIMLIVGKDHNVSITCVL